MQKPADEMTRDELVAEIEHLRGQIGVCEAGEQTNQPNERVEHPPWLAGDSVALQRFLSDLARLSARHKVVLDMMQGDGLVRLTPLADWFGGYVAERVDNGPRVMSIFGHDMVWDDPNDDIVGDDVHPDAREHRAR